MNPRDLQQSGIGLFAELLVARKCLHVEQCAHLQDRRSVGVDRKFAFDAEGRRLALEPGRDKPEAPHLMGSLPLENSIVGPPTNLAVTPDQKTAVIANALRSELQTDGSWRAVPADELFAVDLSSGKPALVKTLKVGSQPSGLAVDATGRRAYVANRDGKSVSVIELSGARSSVLQTVAIGDTVTSVAVSPDGRFLPATKLLSHKVALFKLSAEGLLEVTGRDLPVGLFPWTVTISPDSRRALVTNVGANAASDGNAKTVPVIALDVTPPRVIDHVAVGDAPEGAWWSHRSGKLTLLKRDDVGNYRVGESVDVEAFPEGVGFSTDGRYVYVGNFASSSLSVLERDTHGGVEVRAVVKLPGPPASLRVGSQ